MKKILVVDDYPANRELIVTLVTHIGCLAFEAGDGAEALAIVARENPDLVVCDILMPTMDGYEFVRRLRADPSIAHTQVIFYSAYYREREARNLAASCGVLHVISKPCEPAEIMRIIQLALADPQDRASAAVAPAFDRQHLQVVTDELATKASELQATNNRFAALIDLNLKLASEHDPQLLLEHVCRGARDLLSAKYAVLAVREKNNGGHAYFSTSGIDYQLLQSLAPPLLQNGLLGAVADSRSAHRFTSPGGVPETFGLPAGYPPAWVGLAAPIVSLTQSYGWIFLADKVVQEDFTDEDERILMILGAQVGRIYENGSLYYQLRQRSDQLQTEVKERERTAVALLEMIQRLESLRALDNKILEAHLPADVAKVALEHLARLVPYKGGSVMMIDPSGSAFVLLARHRTSTSTLFIDRLHLYAFGNEEIKALRRGEICGVSDLLDVGERTPLQEDIFSDGMRSYSRLPIMFEGVLAGVLNIDAESPDFFTVARIDIARSIADQLGIALQQANLRQQIEKQAAELEHKVVERTAQLRAANAELEAFSYTVSHDLRAPLRAIDGFSRMLVEEFGQKVEPEALRFIQKITENSERMGTLIDDLLSFAHVGRASLGASEVDMRGLAQQAWHECQPRSGVEFQLGPIPAAQGDRALLKQVWVNLLGNAHKYSSKKENALVQVSASSADSEIVYSVRDNGAGFDMRFYEKLFGVFHRLHSQSEFPGTGVGLAIAQRIIARHGGRIWAESVSGEGATFHFTLPTTPTPIH